MRATAAGLSVLMLALLPGLMPGLAQDLGKGFTHH